MDIFAVIEHEHRAIRWQLDEIDRVQRAGAGALLSRLVTALQERIAAHIEVEEELLYPAACGADTRFDALVRTLASQHRELEALADRLQGVPAADGSFTATLAALSGAFADHAAAGEQELFPELTRALREQRLRLGLRHMIVQRNVDEDALLPQLLAFTLGANSSCIDIGSHRGSMLSEMLRCAPNGRHLAYEPIPQLAHGLRQDFPGVDVREAAVSDAHGTTRFVHVRNALAYSGLRERGGSLRGWPEYVEATDLDSYEVRTERLDTLLADGWVPSLIKIDVEGAEGLVVAGAMEMLVRCRPIVVFEHMGASSAYDTSSADLWDMLVREAGLRIFDLDGRGPYERRTFSACAAELVNTNYVARP